VNFVSFVVEDDSEQPTYMVHIIGGGLAGSEAAWQAASLGVPVTLHEMRPVRATAVHKTERRAVPNGFMASGAAPCAGLKDFWVENFRFRDAVLRVHAA
jgi:choline dehydrogenase-like flavoprotein